MRPYLINALQVFGIGIIAMLIGALWTRLNVTNIKNVKQHALFVATAMAMLGMTAVVSSRLYVGRSMLDNVTWYGALWFFYFFLFWCGFRVSVNHVDHQDFGESSILSMQHLEETRFHTKFRGALSAVPAPEKSPEESYIDSRGTVVQGKRPRS